MGHAPVRLSLVIVGLIGASRSYVRFTLPANPDSHAPTPQDMQISPPVKLAAPFLIVPFVSWLMVLMVVLIAISRRQERQ